MKPELQAIFDSIPEDEPRSRLEPYRDLILRWRRQGKTYRRICVLLADRCNLQTDCGGLYRFVKRRSKSRKLQAESESEQLTLAPAPVSQAAIPRNSGMTDDPYAEARERMRRHKEAPIPEKPRKIFNVSEDDLDASKPLRMMPPRNPKEKLTNVCTTDSDSDS